MYLYNYRTTESFNSIYKDKPRRSDARTISAYKPSVTRVVFHTSTVCKKKHNKKMACVDQKSPNLSLSRCLPKASKEHLRNYLEICVNVNVKRSAHRSNVLHRNNPAEEICLFPDKSEMTYKN